jgi:hypothetical protein
MHCLKADIVHWCLTQIKRHLSVLDRKCESLRGSVGVVTKLRFRFPAGTEIFPFTAVSRPTPMSTGGSFPGNNAIGA